MFSYEDWIVETDSIPIESETLPDLPLTAVISPKTQSPYLLPRICFGGPIDSPVSVESSTASPEQIEGFYFLFSKIFCNCKFCIFVILLFTKPLKNNLS